ncbi:hypothetical protein PG994_005790 [Apiospora phragmitis]|uniref:Uncharacterized protein n=1 Tax=Apiospora phragmitis TaxID=2905665 RepID=A0ABR1VD77_9PEZI
MALPSKAFHKWVSEWETHTITKTKWCDEDNVAVYRNRIKQEGTCTAGAIRSFILDNEISVSSTAIRIVDISREGLGSKGVVPRGLWKAFCLAIEVFSCHHPSRTKLVKLLAELAKHDDMLQTCHGTL